MLPTSCHGMCCWWGLVSADLDRGPLARGGVREVSPGKAAPSACVLTSAEGPRMPGRAGGPPRAGESRRQTVSTYATWSRSGTCLSPFV